ncbi:MAG: iron-molybdenum cofactor biosynthesis protein [bacterium]|nr:iron-molybdenum cofactor biosynthesis protein [bacterium]
MKFAIATDDGDTIAQHTGRCLGFNVYEVVDDKPNQLERRENRHTAHALGECGGDHDRKHSHGAGAHHSHAGLLELLSGCDYLIARGMGRRLVMDLQSAGVTPVFCAEESVSRAAELFARGELRAGELNACGCDH